MAWHQLALASAGWRLKAAISTIFNGIINLNVNINK